MIHVEQFKDYYLTRRIGIGGMAEIFRGRKIGDGGFEKHVVVKRLLPHLAGNDDFRAMFLDEAKLASQLSHPNIVHVYDLGRYEHLRTREATYFIAMEYVFGKNLSEIRKQSVATKLFPSLEHIVRMMIGAALALRYAHFKKDDYGEPLHVVHRDVSPQNILLSYEGEVKLADFGIAKALTRTQHTQSGMLKGKLAYMSPEQAQGESTDFRADIYSLGVVFWELLTGQRLFSGDSEATTLRNVLEPKVDPPSRLSPHVPKELEAACLRCLARDPADRYQDAKALAMDLEAYLRDAPMTTGSHSLRDYMHALFADEILRETREIQEEALAVRTLLQDGGEAVEEVTQAVEATGTRGGGRSLAKPNANTAVGGSGQAEQAPRKRGGKMLALGVAGVTVLALGGGYLFWSGQPVEVSPPEAGPTSAISRDLDESQLEMAVIVDPDRDAAADSLAAMEHGPGDEEAAALAEEAARQAERDHVRAAVQDALRVGDADQALALLDGAEGGVAWSEPDLFALRAASLRIRAATVMDKDLGRALQDLQLAALYHGLDAQVHLALGRLLTRLGQPGHALSAYEQALAIDGMLHEALYNRGVLLLRQGRIQDAEAEFTRTLAQNPPYAADVYVNLAAIKVQMNQLEDALAYLRKALEVDPDHELARHNLRLLEQ